MAMLLVYHSLTVTVPYALTLRYRYGRNALAQGVKALPQGTPVYGDALRITLGKALGKSQGNVVRLQEKSPSCDTWGIARWK